MAGTAQYMAPEQIRGKPRPASDQYALGIVYIGSLDYKLYAINATTGKILWFATTQNVLTSSPTVANGVVYVGSGDTRLYAFNASGCGHPSCSPLWTAPTSDGIDSATAVADGVVYVSSFDGMFYTFDASKGTPLWSASLGQGGGGKSSATVANGLV